jgi:putative aminopeptidase FrvX
VIRLFDWHPSTKLGMFTHRAIRDRLLQVAKDEGIAHQVDVLTSTYLDSSQAHLTAGGIPGGSICFPRRYAHGPVELSHLDDIEAGLKLLIAFMKSVDAQPIKFGKKY